MTDIEVYNLLKQSLGEANPSSAREAYLKQNINAAIRFIEREGITLPVPNSGESSADYTSEDAELIVMYADYLIRKRATDENMPKMLRWNLNNRLFSEKARSDVT